jgi:hypothetical protein
MAGAGVEAMLKGFLSVRRWRGGELDRGWLVVATWCNEGRWRTLAMRTPAGLHQGLDGTPLAAPAPSIGWAAQGFIIELLAQASRLEQRWVVAE